MQNFTCFKMHPVNKAGGRIPTPSPFECATGQWSPTPPPKKNGSQNTAAKMHCYSKLLLSRGEYKPMIPPAVKLVFVLFLSQETVWDKETDGRTDEPRNTANGMVALYVTHYVIGKVFL